MDRVRRLAQLWNYLPAFRVVAETRHLPTASDELGVTAPALSRTIKLLEEQLDQPLFSRAGRRLALNDAGHIFLVAVRNAMRSLHEGIEEIEQSALRGPVRLSARSHHSWIFFRPALRHLREECPELVPHIYNMPSGVALDRLRDGTLDLVVTERPEPHGDLAIDRLTEISYGVYCGAGHPLDREERVGADEVLGHEFLAPVAGIDDHWPKEIDRRVGIHVSAFHDAVHLCASGQYLAMLPDAMTVDYPGPGRLRRLAPELAPRIPVYVVSRRPMVTQPRTEAVLAAVRAQVELLAPPQALVSAGR